MLFYQVCARELFITAEPKRSRRGFWVIDYDDDDDEDGAKW